MSKKTTSRLNILSKSLLLIFSALLFGAGISDKTEKINDYCLTISGKVLSGEKKKSEKVRVYLIKENSIIDSLQTNINSLFAFKLRKNEEYSIKIIEPGYNHRLISISTRMPKKVKQNIFFEFHFDLVSFKASPELANHKDILDFPIALIYYNPQKGCFDYNRKYTSHIKQAYR